ncbi:MAG: hypothetical protein JWP44_5129, partial [Mucilaginibacter sp.]|nr:hypothetical protein [Mucilaginibacter sp.]
MSQPPSENSVSAQAHLRSDDSVKHDATPHLNSKRNGSRIPRFTHGAQNAHSPTRDSSAVLSERSLNDINIPLSRRGPSKLSQEIKPHERGRYSSRSFSASTSNSVVHITVNHKALSASPIRNKGETPEWKRRLVYGDLSYGEQRDLFTSAGAVLENIFKPPAPVPPKSGADDSSEEESRLPQHEVTLPSSPPVYTRDPSTVEIHVEDSAVDDLPDLPDKRAPTAMRYRNTEDSDVSNSNINQSISEEQNPDTFASEEAPSSRNALQPDDNADLRKVSGQTVINEDFSPIMIARHSAEDGKTTFTPVEVPPTELRKRLEKLRRNQKLLMAETEDGMDDCFIYFEDTEDCERLG